MGKLSERYIATFILFLQRLRVTCTAINKKMNISFMPGTRKIKNSIIGIMLFQDIIQGLIYFRVLEHKTGVQ